MSFISTPIPRLLISLEYVKKQRKYKRLSRERINLK